MPQVRLLPMSSTRSTSTGRTAGSSDKVSISFSRVQGEHEFIFACLFRDIAAFISDASQAGGVASQEWVDRWIDESFVEFKTAQRGRALRPEDRQPLEHAARYVAFLQFL